MCRACNAKRILDQDTLNAQQDNERLLEEVERLHKRGLSEDGAKSILAAPMRSERAFIDHNALAYAEASKALTAAKDELEE